MALRWDAKDPDEVLDYKLDWTARLAGDTISSSEWIMSGDLTKNSDSYTDTASTIWLAGGTLNITYILTNRVTTAGGRTMDQSVQLKVKEK